MTTDVHPNSAVCFILADIPGVGEFQATGFIIGPHSILTAAHEVWNADVGKSADAISIYPGFEPAGTTYNPSGALGGIQAIHFLPVADSGDNLSAKGTQHDFAVIDTSADLTQYGQFALDPSFVTGDTFTNGYPAAHHGNLAGIEQTVSANWTYSDLDTTSLSLSPGYSGSPIWHDVVRNGVETPAVVGIVSTGDEACKITRPKVGLIRRWIQSDAALWDGEGMPEQGTVPQIGGTV